MYTVLIPVPEKLRQKDSKFEANLGHIVSLHLKKNGAIEFVMGTGLSVL